MDPRRIAVLSDLHVGDLARSADLSRPTNTAGKPDGYLTEHREYVAAAAIEADILLVAGDITDRAHPVEFDVAARALETLAQTYGLSMDSDVLVVPGNHDVNWKSLSQFPDDSTAYSQQSRYYPLRFAAWPFEKMMSDGISHLCEPPYFLLRRRADSLIVSFNSSSHDGPYDAPDKPHYGLAPDASLVALERVLDASSYDSSELRIFLVHHHVVPRDERARDRLDPSLIVNSADLLELLGRYRFDLVVHGHKHLPAVSTHLTSTNAPLVIIGAGSFSASIDPANSGPIQNYFHSIEVDDRDADGFIRGRVKSWAYVTPEGWQAGADVLGIDHLSPFGCSKPIASLYPPIVDFVRNRISAQRFVVWSEILSEFPDLQYLSRPATKALLEEVANSCGVVSVGEPPLATLIDGS